jgi:hypothetical protein
MRLLQLAAVLFALGGCDSGGTNPPSDSPAATPDAARPDAPSGVMCTGAVYDPCTANAQCMSNNCHLYQGQNLQVCVTTCTPGNNSTCPVDRTGVNGTCNNMGICRPAQANNCMR